MRQTAWDDVYARSKVSPQAVAIRDVAESGDVRDITYAELIACATELGDELTARSAPNTLVALDAMTPAGEAIAILAATVASRAILPLNAELPPLLRREVLADARPALLVTQSAGPKFGVDVADTEEPARRDQCGVAYVLYTSGSTGRPKGVVVPHEALRQRLRGLSQVPGLSVGESMMAMTAPSFDISLAEILLPLTVGGSVISVPAAARLDPQVFARYADRFCPDVLQATPSFWRLALAWGWQGCAGARIWCGGESLTSALADQLLPACGELWNLYGPTEATIWATAAQVAPGQPISLGAPLPGSGLIIIDELAEDGRAADRVVTGPGQPGEIWLYGAGLARGYLNREDLTRERFRPQVTPAGKQICYQTGDRAQYRDDGSLEFLGRTDHQVKLRGHRIELGEVEAVLEECPDVSEAAVLLGAAQVPERAHLAAFLVVRDAVTTASVRRWAAERLPPSMRPSTFLLLPALPRTTAGKIDRPRLAEDYARHDKGARSKTWPGCS